MKYLLELVLTTMVIFFVWNILRRMFLPPPRQTPTKPDPKHAESSKHGLNWDAEEAEFEEIKDDEKLKK